MFVVYLVAVGLWLLRLCRRPFGQPSCRLSSRSVSIMLFRFRCFRVWSHCGAFPNVGPILIAACVDTLQRVGLYLCEKGSCLATLLLRHAESAMSIHLTGTS